MRMAVGEGSNEPEEDETLPPQDDGPADRRLTTSTTAASVEEDDDAEEPRLKYANLTRNLSGLYRNGDAASAFFVAGDKLVIGTHNGNIHVLALPSLEPLRIYHAHSASVSAISISPYPPPLPTLKLDVVQKLATESNQERDRSPSGSPAGKNSPRRPPVPNIPSNQIFIATSSIDGNVCVSSLVDSKDQLRNFGRPVQTVALSPEYKSDRNYLSGGQAGSLILTNGGQTGKRANATTTGAAAAASGWLGSIGLGDNTGTDRVLHSGEGIISTIKWSLSGKYVLWVNEHGIKIMRSDLNLESHEAGYEWKRISHIDKPNRPGWDEMAGVWKARAEWVNRSNLEVEDEFRFTNGAEAKDDTPDIAATNVEEVLVGWGDTAWLIKVHPGDGVTGQNAGEKKVARAVVASIIRFDDCTISGISLYTPKLLLVLAYMEKKQAKDSVAASDGTKKGRRHRQSALEPELRMIDINTKEEIDTDTLTISRYETLSATDYHIGILPRMTIPAALAQRGLLSSGLTALGSGVTTVGSGLYTGVETVGQGVWDATMYGPRKLGANRLFSGAESVRSATTGTDPDKSGSVKERNYLTGWLPGFGSNTNQQDEEVKDVAQTMGMKIFIFSPYDCIIAVKRNMVDRLHWLTEMQRYQDAWELLDAHPEAAGSASEPADSTPPTPSKASSVARSGSAMSPAPTRVRQQATLADFFTDSASFTSSVKDKSKDRFSKAEKEKRRIGELWLKQLVAAKSWAVAGEVTTKVLNTTSAWESWVWTFVKNNKFDEISPYVPALELTPPLPALIFEVILGHYVSSNRTRFKELLDQWPSDLFEINSITSAIEEQLKSDTASQGSKDLQLLQECLAKLFLAGGHYDDALRCYIQLNDADTALTLVKEHHLIESITDDIPSFVQLRVSADQLETAPREELQELASEPIRLLVDEAESGVIQPDEVVSQLQAAGLKMFLFLYLRALWKGEGTHTTSTGPKGRSAAASNLTADTGKILVEDFADSAVELFAEYDRNLLNDFLHTSTAYTFEAAVKICEKKHYFNELVYLLSKTGQMKKALFLIIDELGDVTKAIEFAKEQNDKDLWDDFLEYSMSRPRFIAGLLAEVGMAIDPITLIKRIPTGLEIEGLKHGLRKMLREYDLQDSISAGVAQVLSSEVAVRMNKLRVGRRKGIKFEVPQHKRRKQEPSIQASETSDLAKDGEVAKDHELTPGQCASCHKDFHPDEKGIVVGFACGHVYHLTHLIHGPDAEGTDPLGLPGAKGEDDDEIETFTRSIGPKVTTARLLKDKIEAVGGCAICKAERMLVNEVDG